jgi:hypothetical protein
MPWSPLSDLIPKRLNQHHLMPVITAGKICQQAELIALNLKKPGLFQAISVKNGILHLKVHPAKLIELKLIEGKVLEDLNLWLLTEKLPALKRIRLTIEE